MSITLVLTLGKKNQRLHLIINWCFIEKKNILKLTKLPNKYKDRKVKSLKKIADQNHWPQQTITINDMKALCRLMLQIYYCKN